MKISQSETKLLGFWSTIAIGIGGMVGGGIFAVLGLAVEEAKGGTPVAFFIAGSCRIPGAYYFSLEKEGKIYYIAVGS